MLLDVCQQLSTYKVGEGVFMRFVVSVWCHHHSADSQINNCLKEWSLATFFLKKCQKNSQEKQRTSGNNKPRLVPVTAKHNYYYLIDFIFGILPGHSCCSYLILHFIKMHVAPCLKTSLPSCTASYYSAQRS